jgi:hypothetical protein
MMRKLIAVNGHLNTQNLMPPEHFLLQLYIRYFVLVNDITFTNLNKKKKIPPRSMMMMNHGNS